MVIQINFDHTPVLISEDIPENTEFWNDLMGLRTLIIDKDFIDEMNKIASEYQLSSNFIKIMTDVNNMVNNYYYSSNENDLSRSKAYSMNYVQDEDGMIIGTKLSSFKGKNVAECSEKSIAAYMILKKLLQGKKFKPSIMLSDLKTEASAGAHAFIVLDNESAEYPSKHILFDVHNPAEIVMNGEKTLTAGLYGLTDEEYSDLLEGKECSPKLLLEIFDSNYKEIGKKRIYGAKSKEKLVR